MYAGSKLKNIKIHNSSKYFSTLTVSNKKSVPKTISYVKTQKPPFLEGSRKLNVISAAPNHPADRLTHNPDKALSHGLVKNVFTKNTLSATFAKIKFGEELA